MYQNDNVWSVDQRLGQGNFCHGVPSVAARVCLLTSLASSPGVGQFVISLKSPDCENGKETANIQILVREKRKAAVEEKKGQCSDCGETANMEARSHFTNANGANLDSLI